MNPPPRIKNLSSSPRFVNGAAKVSKNLLCTEKIDAGGGAAAVSPRSTAGKHGGEESIANLERIVRGRRVGAVQIPLPGGVGDVLEIEVDALLAVFGHHRAGSGGKGGSQIKKRDQWRIPAEPAAERRRSFVYLRFVRGRLRREGFTASLVPLSELAPRPLTVTGRTTVAAAATEAMAAAL